MDAGAVAPTAVGNAGLPQKSAEVLLDVPEGQRLPGPAGEEPVPAEAPEEVGVVVGEPFAQRRADGQLPVFAALGVADLQYAGGDVDVVGAQQARFGGTQAAGVDRAK